MSVGAVILAAGRGTRLGARYGSLPKCLLGLGGTTLLGRQLAALRACGVQAVTVVAGFQAARVADACRTAAEVIVNPRFAETNSLYSLWLARARLAEGAVVMNGDVLFHPQLLRDLLSSRHEDALLVAYRDAAASSFGDEEMKVRVRGGRVLDLSKALPPGEADGENVGMARFSRAGGVLLAGLLDDLVAAGCERDWAPRAFQAFAARRPLHAVGTRGFPWIEIDFADDYLRAAGDVLPQVDESPTRPDEDDHLAAPAPLVPAGDSAADWRPQTRHV
jgi:L-glutamine-phosphate cytidylyltransferase